MSLTKKQAMEIMIMNDNGYSVDEIKKVVKVEEYVIKNVIKMQEFIIERNITKDIKKTRAQ